MVQLLNGGRRKKEKWEKRTKEKEESKRKGKMGQNEKGEGRKGEERGRASELGKGCLLTLRKMDVPA